MWIWDESIDLSINPCEGCEDWDELTGCISEGACADVQTGVKENDMKHDELIIKLYGIWHTTEGNAKDIIKEAIDAIELQAIDEQPSAQHEWNNHTVACLLAELFDDTCACNHNGIDEWLPEKCELWDSCPDPCGVACWEQFLKHRAERRADEHDT